jgi:redox-sensing transcriptional repressor
MLPTAKVKTLAARRRIPEATVARLPRYLQALIAAGDAEQDTVSSQGLARAAGVNSAIVRKDLSHLGALGRRGVGYDVAGLMEEISTVLGLSSDRSVVIVGLGNLGRALAAYDGFHRRGFRIVALVDADPGKIGSLVGDLRIESADDLEDIVAERVVQIAVLATPAQHAQDAADRLIAAGVRAILNFAPVHLDGPDHVSIRRVDLSTELQILSFYEQLHAGAGGGEPAVGG